MRHKYQTRGIVLSRISAGEANASVVLLTMDVGLVRARAQGVRRPGAKLAAALTTFSESELMLVQGKEFWRVAGAVLKENWFLRIGNSSARARAARICNLLLRLVAGETRDTLLFPIITEFFELLASLPEERHEETEIIAALRILAALGLDTGEIPKEISNENRTSCIRRINRGIEASGL
jgi:recombinational DNA repair protein (RecF pathway)